MVIGDRVEWRHGKRAHAGTILSFHKAFLFGTAAVVRCLEGRYHTVRVHRLRCLQSRDDEFAALQRAIEHLKQTCVTNDRHEKELTEFAGAVGAIQEQLRTTGRRK